MIEGFLLAVLERGSEVCEIFGCHALGGFFEHADEMVDLFGFCWEADVAVVGDGGGEDIAIGVEDGGPGDAAAICWVEAFHDIVAVGPTVVDFDPDVVLRPGFAMAFEKLGQELAGAAPGGGFFNQNAFIFLFGLDKGVCQNAFGIEGERCMELEDGD